MMKRITDSQQYELMHERNCQHEERGGGIHCTLLNIVQTWMEPHRTPVSFINYQANFDSLIIDKSNISNLNR